MGRIQGRIVFAVFAALFISLGQTRAQAVTGLKATNVATGLVDPLFVTAPPGDTNRLFIVQRGGKVLILNLATLTLNATPFLDISATLTGNNEQGLLGFAFDPAYATNGRFYVDLALPGPTSGSGITRIAQFQVSADPNVANAASMKTILDLNEPGNSHNGGWIGFSPRPNDDHNLYIATGDGGGENDAGPGHDPATGNAQSLTSPLGKMLRIHVDPITATYTIPPNNPYAGSGSALQTIFLLGLRNPFRCSFDRVTGRMLLGDVGQDNREEIDAQEASNPSGGENYGWRLREGTIATPPTPSGTPVGGPPPPNNVDPIYDYPHTIGKTVIGGYVYRGRQIPALWGTYVFADFLGMSGSPDTNKIYTLNYNGGGTATNVQDITTQLYPVAGTLNNPVSLGEDANGELYICDKNKGNVARIEPVTPNVKIDNVTRNGASVSVHGFGVPFKTHTIQTASAMGQSFTNLSPITALGDGSFQFPETTNATTRFYRVTYP
jgi:glucose/arabinose dehydrogenase